MAIFVILIDAIMPLPKSIPLILYVITLTFLSSCRNGRPGGSNCGYADKKKGNISLVSLLIGSGNFYFRNISRPGESLEDVKKSEKKAPDETDSNYLAYTLNMDTLHPDSVNGDIDSVNFFTIAYNFEQQKLTEIDEDVFLATDSMAANLYSRLSGAFTARYGKGNEAGDSMVWSYKSEGKNLNVSLSDQSPEYDYGKLSLVFYSED